MQPLGDTEAARQAVDRVLHHDSSATIAKWASAQAAPYTYPDDRKHYQDNLRKAGLPE